MLWGVRIGMCAARRTEITGAIDKMGRTLMITDTRDVMTYTRTYMGGILYAMHVHVYACTDGMGWDRGHGMTAMVCTSYHCVMLIGKWMDKNGLIRLNMGRE